MIKLLIFDLSGVCFSLEEPMYLKQFSREHHLSATALEQFYTPLVEASERGMLSGAEIWRRVLKRFRIRASPERIVSEMMSLKRPRRTVLRFAGRMRSRFRVAYFTNYNRVYWHAVNAKFLMTQWFDGGIVSYQIRSRKPAREGFSAILRAFHARPEEAIYIDDSERNVASARRLGIHGIRYTSLRGLRREIEAISDRFKKGAALPNCKRFSA